MTIDQLRPLTDFLDRGGPAMWLIFVLSVLLLAIVLWKLWHFLTLGMWSGIPNAALDAWAAGQPEAALTTVSRSRAVRRRMAAHAMAHCLSPELTEDFAREETARRAKAMLADTATGLRALELIGTIAPLLGLFGTVLGMIEAFQALQEAGSRADPAALAGGIWEALLTTAAGMGVAMPAVIALAWFESQTDRLRLDLEAIATRVHTRPPSGIDRVAAE